MSSTWTSESRRDQLLSLLDHSRYGRTKPQPDVDLDGEKKMKEDMRPAETSEGIYRKKNFTRQATYDYNRELSTQFFVVGGKTKLTEQQMKDLYNDDYMGRQVECSKEKGEAVVCKKVEYTPKDNESPRSPSATTPEVAPAQERPLSSENVKVKGAANVIAAAMARHFGKKGAESQMIDPTEAIAFKQLLTKPPTAMSETETTARTEVFNAVKTINHPRITVESLGNILAIPDKEYTTIDEMSASIVAKIDALALESGPIALEATPPAPPARTPLALLPTQTSQPQPPLSPSLPLQDRLPTPPNRTLALPARPVGTAWEAAVAANKKAMSSVKEFNKKAAGAQAVRTHISTLPTDIQEELQARANAPRTARALEQAEPRRHADGDRVLREEKDDKAATRNSRAASPKPKEATEELYRKLRSAWRYLNSLENDDPNKVGKEQVEMNINDITKEIEKLERMITEQTGHPPPGRESLLRGTTLPAVFKFNKIITNSLD